MGARVPEHVRGRANDDGHRNRKPGRVGLAQAPQPRLTMGRGQKIQQRSAHGLREQRKQPAPLKAQLTPKPAKRIGQFLLGAAWRGWFNRLMNESKIPDAATPDIYQIRTKASGPAGSLPLTEEMLLNRPSGDVFGLTQNA